VGDRHGLIVDYGGVLTTTPFASFEAFCAVEGLPPDAVLERFRDDPAAGGLMARLETGELASEEFEREFAAMLGVAPEHLLRRMFGGMELDRAMIDGLRAIRRAGTPMGLLSNAIGESAVYDRALLEELFDAWVISNEVGMRKPDPAIYELAVERIGLPAAACVYVDDIGGNLKPARALGMATILHRGDAVATLAEVRALLT
jgi:epoxide hydrolase-like predicted phosphatase